MEKDLLPLHPAQRDVYTDQLVNTGSPHYNIGGYIRLKGNLDIEKFHETINSIPRVYDVFKMRFQLGDIEPKCYIDEQFESVKLEEMDFTSADQTQQSALQWMKAQFNKAFILEDGGLLFENYLLRIAPDEHYFYGRYHHLLTDGYGFILLVQYIAKKYKSLAGETDLEFVHPSYLEETAEAAKYFNAPGYQDDEQYWKQRIVEKPVDVLLPKYEQYNLAGATSGVYTLDTPAGKKQLLEELQLTAKVGLQHLTIAALIAYFGKTTNQQEFVFGIPVHKRNSKRLRNIIGMFSGVLPFKGTYHGATRVIDLLKEIVQAQKADYRHQHFPLGDLSRLLKVKSGEGYLHQVTINYEPFDFAIDFGDEIKAEVVRLTSDHERNPLQLSWREYGEDQPLRLYINFSNRYFSHDEMELLAGRLLFIMEQFADGLENNLESIEIIPGKEKLLLTRFSGSAHALPRTRTLVDLFEEQVEKTPGSIALVYQDRELTYQELNESSNRFAHLLKSKGVKDEQLVPLCIERSTEMIIAILGILKAGAAYVPIDPQYPAERIGFMLQDTAAAICVISRVTKSLIQEIGSLEIICVEDLQSSIADHSTANLQLTIAPGRLAYIIYTSGSTGRPKGVMIEHETVVNLISAQTANFNITPEERILQFSNYCFDASVEQIFLALTNGARLVLFAEGLQLDSEKFQQLLIDQEITHLHATPSFLENLSAASNTYLKRVIAGGDLCKHDLASHWNSSVSFYNEYGPTETTVTSIEYKVEATDLMPTLSLPIGKPLSNIYVYIVDQHQQLCPVGVPGELYIGGDCVARGYLNRPELTEEKFIKNPFENGGQIYKTGDIGCWLPDGNILYQGRMDEQVKIRGYRIELGEIENTLQEHATIRQAVVLARKDTNGSNRLVAYVVPKEDFDSTVIQQYLKSRLPDYMIPSLWVQLESIPLTSNGKVDRKNLPEPATSELVSNEYEAPKSEMQIQLAGMWEQVLKVEKVGIHNNFFELGGHSLNAIQLATRLHKILQIKIDVAEIFSNPTIDQLARVLELKQRSVFEPIGHLPEQEYYPLSHAQERFWVLSHFKDGSEAYNISSAFSIAGNLMIPAFKKAFDAVIERHEILRTVFIEIDGKAKQQILPAKNSGFNVAEIDLSNSADKNTYIRNWLQEDTKRSFDLSKGPLLSATLFYEAPEKYTLAFNIHHIISDGWSKGIFIKEFLAFYKAFSSNTPITLAPLPIQYKDYAAWHSASFEAQGKYWKERYRDNIPVLTFPSDFERPKVLTFFGAMTHASLQPALIKNLRKIAVENNVSLNNLFLSLYAFIVARYSNQQEVVVGSLTSGRSHVDLENLIGVFINFLPIRFGIDRKQSLKEYLALSNNVLSQAYNNQDYPFDLMVADCIRQRDISRNPFFDTMLNFHLENDLQGSSFGEDQLIGTGIQIRPQQDLQDQLFQSVLDFKLDVELAGEAMDLYLSYNSKLFTGHTMNNFLEDFVGLLQEVATDSNKTLEAYGEWKEQVAPGKAEDKSSQTVMLPVNICSSFVMEPVQEYIEYWSNEVDLNIKLSFAPYNQVFQQLLDPGSLLNTSKGINVLFIRIEDWLREQTALPLSGQVDFLDKTFAEFTQAISQVTKQNFSPFLMAVIPVLNTKNFAGEIVSHISGLNDQLESIIKKQSGFHLLDLEKITRLYDVEEIYDAKSDELGHMPFTQEFYAAIGTYLARKVSAFKGPNYKVLALDCDNTLWRGICGEVGASEVIIDENFTALQEFFIQKYNEGFLLVLCSKNNEPDVWEVFSRHPGMKLKREHIAAHRINWEPKSSNLQSLAKELNLGLSSFIFLDDNEFEVEQINGTIPEVLGIALPEDADSFESFLNHIWAFDYFRITEEDTKRNQMYQVEKQRREEEVKYGSVADFLQSLNIQVNISPISENNIERAVQLTLRTNQFNLNGIRRSAEEISRGMQQANAINWVIEVQDRFGEYGIVGVVLARQMQQSLMVETFLLSCRVLGRNVEDQVLAELENHCLRQEISLLNAQFIATPKNKPFQEFLSRTQWKVDPHTNNYFRLQENIAQTTV